MEEIRERIKLSSREGKQASEQCERSTSWTELLPTQSTTSIHVTTPYAYQYRRGMKKKTRALHLTDAVEFSCPADTHKKEEQLQTAI